MDNVVSLSDMKRDDWIKYQWENVTEFGDKEPKYLRMGLRPIEQRKEAMEQFDALWLSKGADSL